MSLSDNFSVITSKKPFNLKTSKLSTFLLKFEITVNESFNKYIFSEMLFLTSCKYCLSLSSFLLDVIPFVPVIIILWLLPLVFLPNAFRTSILFVANLNLGFPLNLNGEGILLLFALLNMIFGVLNFRSFVLGFSIISSNLVLLFILLLF